MAASVRRSSSRISDALWVLKSRCVYARSRHQDSDYGRMRRQQAVLVALAREVDPIALLPKVPNLLEIAADNLWTTVPRSEVRAMAELAARAETGHVRTVQFVPSRYPSHLDSAEIAQIPRVVRSAFEGPSSRPSSSPDAPSKACPKPAPAGIRVHNPRLWRPRTGGSNLKREPLVA